MCRILLILCCCLAPLGEASESQGVAILAGKLITMDAQDRVLNQAVVLAKDGKIQALGHEDEIKVPKEYRIIDARDRWVVPGLVDYHSHIGGSLSDLNDGVFLTNPGLRVDECYKPDNPNMRDARAAGVTTLLVIPGSGNNMAGFGIIYKNNGKRLEESALANPGCSKMSQAGNPERYWFRVGRSFMYWNLRRTLECCKAYHEAWCAYEQGKSKEKPEMNLSYEPFRALFEGKLPTCLHTQIYQVCMSSFLLFHDHFGFWTVPTHSTFDAYKLAGMAAERGICIIAGPRNVFVDRQERRINGVAAKWAEGGVTLLGTETDSPVLPIEEHTYQAALASRMGWNSYDALKGVTLATARGGMVENRVGSIEVGKDADFGVWTGDPLDPRSSCCLTIIDGCVTYNKENGQRY